MRKIRYMVLPVFVLLFGAAVYHNAISADSTDLGRPESSQNIELNIDGGKTTFILEKHKNGDTTDFWLKKKATFGRKPIVKLSGFEDSISLCDQAVLDLGGDAGQAICFVGDVGVHSRNIQIIKFKDNNFSVLKVNQDGLSNESITTDVPKFSFLDKNNDGKVDLIVDQRDYDKNPLMDMIQSIYLSTGTGFLFDGSENIPYN